MIINNYQKIIQFFCCLFLIPIISSNIWSQARIQVKVVSVEVTSNVDCDGILSGNSDYVWEYIATDNTLGNSNNNPVLFGFLGDFNFRPKSFLHHFMTSMLGLNDSHQEYVLDNPDLSVDQRNGYTNGKLTKRIDYVWCSAEFRTEKVEVIMTKKLYKNEPLSDHKAVLATFDY